jgi:hypothetical protein
MTSISTLIDQLEIKILELKLINDPSPKDLKEDLNRMKLNFKETAKRAGLRGLTKDRHYCQYQLFAIAACSVKLEFVVSNAIRSQGQFRSRSGFTPEKPGNFS